MPIARSAHVHPTAIIDPEADLGEDVYAIAVLGDHALDTAHLALDTAKATMQLILGGRVPALWHHRSSLAHHGNGSTNPWGVC